MKTDNNYVRSGRVRLENDNYQTIDGRCMEALTETFSFGGDTLVDVCAPQGSGIVDWFDGSNVEARGISDAFSDFEPVTWIVSNPPYARNIVDKIIYRQLERLQYGGAENIALLLRTGFDHAKTRRKMFADCPYYSGQLKMLFRPKWFEDGDITPIHNYVWHVWAKLKYEKYPVVWYWG